MKHGFKTKFGDFQLCTKEELTKMVWVQVEYMEMQFFFFFTKLNLCRLSNTD